MFSTTHSHKYQLTGGEIYHKRRHLKVLSPFVHILQFSSRCVCIDIHLFMLDSVNTLSFTLYFETAAASKGHSNTAERALSLAIKWPPGTRGGVRYEREPMQRSSLRKMDTAVICLFYHHANSILLSLSCYVDLECTKQLLGHRNTQVKGWPGPWWMSTHFNCTSEEEQYSSEHGNQ